MSIPGDFGDLGDPGFMPPDQFFPGSVPPTYSPGNNYPVPSGAYAQSPAGCCEGNICNCLEGAISTVVTALYTINKTLDEKLSAPCKTVEECTDKILEAIKKRLERPLATCEECKAMVANGLGGTLQYAIACASVTCDECETQACSLGDPTSEGKCCKGCGKEPCCCDKGECVPCGEEEKPKTKFQGWCNPETGMVSVTEEDKQGPPGYFPTGLAESEQAATELAIANCGRYQSTQTAPTSQVNPPPVSNFAPLCDLSQFYNGAALQALSPSGTNANLIDGEGQWVQALGRLGIDGVNLNNLGEIIVGLWRANTGAPTFWGGRMLPSALSLVGCKDQQWQTTLQTRSAIDRIGKLCSVDLSPFLFQFDYALNAGCRQRYLDPGAAMAAYLGNAIDGTSLDAHWAIAGYCPESVQQTLSVQRAKPIPLQLAVMRHREIITPAQYQAGMRQLGYLEPAVAEDLFRTTYQVPTQTDLIRFMVRDADDKSLVDRFGLDDEFDKKYRDQLKKWSKDQGVDETILRYAWRSHWGIPSPGQLFTFYHRLRNDPKFGGKEKLLDNIKAALIQQDILPFWHEHFLATSFHPLTRVDTRRAFQLGVLKEKDVRDSYLNQGYSDENADILTKFSVKLRDQSARGHNAIKLWLKFAINRVDAKQRMLDDGVPDAAAERALSDSEILFKASDWSSSFVKGDVSRSTLLDALTTQGVSAKTANRIADLLSLKITSNPALNDYIVGSMSEANARQNMVDDGMSPPVVDRLLKEASRGVDNAFVLACQRGIKRRYLMGEIDKQQAANELSNSGTTAERAARLTSGWDCEKSSVGRTVTANKLCSWLARGSITPQDFKSRLMRIGYSEENAALMLDDCLISINAKRLAQAKKDAKEQQAESSRAARIIAQQNAESEKIAARLAKGRADAAKATERRRAALIKGAERIAPLCNCTLYQAITFAEDQFKRLQSQYGLSKDESLQTIILAAEGWEGGDLSTLPPIIDAMATAERTIQPDPVEA